MGHSFSTINIPQCNVYTLHIEDYTHDGRSFREEAVTELNLLSNMSAKQKISVNGLKSRMEKAEDPSTGR